MYGHARVILPVPVNVFGCLPHRHKYAKYVTPRQHHNTKVSEVSRVIQHIKIQINSIISILRPSPSTSNTLKKLMNQLAGKKTKKHTLFTYALGKIKLFRVKESVYFQKLVKYSTRSESHPHTHTRHPARTIPRYVLHMRR